MFRLVSPFEIHAHTCIIHTYISHTTIHTYTHTRIHTYICTYTFILNASRCPPWPVRLALALAIALALALAGFEIYCASVCLEVMLLK